MKAGISFLRDALPLPPRQLKRSGLTLQETEERRKTGMRHEAGSAYLASQRVSIVPLED